MYNTVTFKVRVKPLKASQRTHLQLTEAVIALHPCFDLVSNEPQWAEVSLLQVNRGNLRGHESV